MKRTREIYVQNSSQLSSRLHLLFFFIYYR